MLLKFIFLTANYLVIHSRYVNAIVQKNGLKVLHSHLGIESPSTYVLQTRTRKR